jgi:metal-sulfur cluster biosynthetic enzyme/uncharacterized membrane protein YjjB (DUF3815 family)
LTLFSVGFGISVQGTWQEVGVSAVTGLLVGLLVVAGSRSPRLAAASPFLASVLVSAVVLELFQHTTLEGGPIQLIIPALFYFIPGDAITAGALELAGNRITAGASRLVYSLVVLLVLAFGALVATVIVQVPEHALFDVTVQGNLGLLWTWGGWVLFALGVMFAFSMAVEDFPWALALVLLTAAAAELGTHAFGDPVGTFVGALVMTSVALLLGRFRALPPPFVLYLGAFYVLTPGSHGLRGIESWIGGDPIQGVTSLGTMVGPADGDRGRHAGRRRRAASARRLLGTLRPMTRDDVIEALRSVEDPELGMDIVELGLLYDAEVQGPRVKVLYSLTSMGCPAGPLIQQNIEEVVRAMPEVEEVETELTWDPPWTPEKMSDDAKFILGFG